MSSEPRVVVRPAVTVPWLPMRTPPSEVIEPVPPSRPGAEVLSAPSLLPLPTRMALVLPLLVRVPSTIRVPLEPSLRPTNNCPSVVEVREAPAAMVNVPVPDSPMLKSEPVWVTVPPVRL